MEIIGVALRSLRFPVNGLDKRFHAFDRRVREHPVAKVDDMAARAHLVQQRLRRRPRRFGTRGQNGWINVALHRAPVAVAFLERAEVDPPIHGESFRRQPGIGLHQMRGIVDEQDSRDSRFAHSVQHGFKMRPDQTLPARARQQASPGIEDLYGADASLPLANR